jgi:hypothetical protein
MQTWDVFPESNPVKRKNFFLRSAGFNVFAFLRMRVGLLRMPVAVAASAMNAGGFPFRGTEEAAFGRFPAVSAMAGRFCRVHGRRRIAGWGELRRCSAVALMGKGDIAETGAFAFRGGQVLCVAVHLASVQCASHMRQHTYQVCGLPAICGSTLSKCARGWGWGGGSLYT